MSRRDDIDEDTLSHYFDRLDEEWTRGAKEKVLQLLRTSDVAAHSAAILILSELATSFDLEDLEDFVADPTVGDLAKLTLAPVLKELGSDMADDGIIDYLNDPEAAMLQMQTRLLELIGQSEMGIESVLEDVLSMPMERRLSFVGWLGMSQDPRAIRLLLPLLENQSTKVVQATIEALEQLGPIAAPHSIPALNYLISNSSNRQVKQLARAALGRLTMQSEPGVETTLQRELHQPLHDARVSYIDGAGAQMIMLAWNRPDGLLKGVNVLYEDSYGIKDCYGADEMETGRWDELVGGMDEQGFGSYSVPLAYCRALIAEARVVNKRTRHKVPVAYAVWRPFIEGDQSGEHAIATTLEAQPLTPELAQLAQRGGDLYILKEFTSWFFDPFASVHLYIMPYTNALGRHAPARGRKRKGEAKPPRQAELESIVTEALQATIDEKWRALYNTRLRRQAALFQLIGREADSQLVMAVSAMLHPDSGVPVQDQPFLRTMMHRTLESGLLRMMTEALEARPFGNGLPINIFPEEDEFPFT